MSFSAKIYIPGFDWETIYSVYGYNSTNVKNWDEATEYINNLYKDFLIETIKETEELIKKINKKYKKHEKK